MGITAQQAREISEGRLIVRDGQLVRADTGVRQADDLVLHERRDDAGRIIREWSGPKAAWMDSYKAPIFLQTVMSADPVWNRRVHQERLAAMGL